MCARRNALFRDTIGNVSINYRQIVDNFIDSGAEWATLGMVYGRRRIGKSTLLNSVSTSRQGFYWEATRTESRVQLARLGDSLGEHLGTGSLALTDWPTALTALLRLGAERSVPVVIDEFGYVLESSPGVDSDVAAALGSQARRTGNGQARLVLCGSAITVLSALTAGQAPLRGRAGMELVMHPHDFRTAATWLETDDLTLAVHTHAVIGGVIGYATDMVDYDLPKSKDDFDSWIVRRVLSPGATLHHEGATLLAEDPALSSASPVLHHAILGAIANGSVTAGKIAKRLGRTVSNLDPALRRLISAGFVIRHSDPIRSQRPVYSLADPFLQFHYAILEPYSMVFREREPTTAWQHRLESTFHSRVLGPTFEEQCRIWVRRFATESTIGGSIDHVGQSVVTIDRVERQIDLVVAAGDDCTPSERSILAIGECKAGSIVGTGVLTNLERARAAFGDRANGAKLLLFATSFTPELARIAAARPDIELVDLERLYYGE